jgi:arginyl-tRNA--protein-N-Asp/Glu arginylyltransferase
MRLGEFRNELNCKHFCKCHNVHIVQQEHANKNKIKKCVTESLEFI